MYFLQIVGETKFRKIHVWAFLPKFGDDLSPVRKNKARRNPQTQEET